MYKSILELDPQENTLLDLRTAEELKQNGMIADSLWIPVDDLRDRVDELDKSKTYILYCAIGLRGYIAYRILKQKGIRVKNLSGGFLTYNHAIAH